MINIQFSVSDFFGMQESLNCYRYNFNSPSYVKKDNHHNFIITLGALNIHKAPKEIDTNQMKSKKARPANCSNGPKDISGMGNSRKRTAAKMTDHDERNPVISYIDRHYHSGIEQVNRIWRESMIMNDSPIRTLLNTTHC